VIRLKQELLPPGLSAIVRRRADGDLDVIVSSALSAGHRRAAVRAGLRAIQPADRRAGPVPVPALIALALAGNWLRDIGRLLRLHPVATVAAAATATAAAVVFAVAPPVHGPVVGGQNPPTRVQQPGSAVSPPAGGGRASPSAPAVARPTPSAVPVAASASTGATTTPAPAASQPNPATSAAQPMPGAPTPTPGAGTPAATPSGTATGRGGGLCLELLGLWVCL
jgi:hypothetical protein